MDYSQYMNEMLDLSRAFWNHGLCESCGGTGIYPIMCCDGYMCGCKGLPYDFDLKCPDCGRELNSYQAT